MRAEILVKGYQCPAMLHLSLPSSAHMATCRELLVILTDKQLQAKETLAPLLPLDCTQVLFVDISHWWYSLAYRVKKEETGNSSFNY